MNEYQICSNCVMDSSDPEIFFDQTGVCNHCLNYYNKKNEVVFDNEKKHEELIKILTYLKKNGKNKKYDCIIGVSGGVDSTYVAYLTSKFKLRPLAVHLDNCWDSELAVHNINMVLQKLNIDLFTHVLDWESFKDLQLSFLKASTPDSEIPTDHAIYALLRQLGDKYGVPIIDGVNISTESVLPKSWSQGHYDWSYIKNVHSLYGTTKLKNYPHTTYLDLFYYNRIKRQKIISILNYVEYNKENAKKLITEELNWIDYGGKHYESIYTRFYQAHILPKKFNFDKRRAHLTSLILSCQITRSDAILELKHDLYPAALFIEHKQYLLKKLGLNELEFEEIMRLPLRNYADYKSKVVENLIKIEKGIFIVLSKIKQLLSN